MAEQFVFQHLHYGTGFFDKEPLYYWLNEKKNSNAELDLLMETDRGKILPIEIKSEHSHKLKSLIHFMSLRKLPLAVKVSKDPLELSKISTHHFNGQKKVAVNFDLLNVPIYAIEKLMLMANKQTSSLKKRPKAPV